MTHSDIKDSDKGLWHYFFMPIKKENKNYVFLNASSIFIILDNKMRMIFIEAQ